MWSPHLRQSTDKMESQNLQKQLLKICDVDSVQFESEQVCIYDCSVKRVRTNPEFHIPTVFFRAPGILDDTLRWAMQTWLNRSICRLACRLGWTEGSTSSIVFAGWRQCALQWKHIGATLAHTTEPSVWVDDNNNNTNICNARSVSKHTESEAQNFTMRHYVKCYVDHLLWLRNFTWNDFVEYGGRKFLLSPRYTSSHWRPKWQPVISAVISGVISAVVEFIVVRYCWTCLYSLPLYRTPFHWTRPR